jgi:hypothetical protein
MGYKASSSDAMRLMGAVIGSTSPLEELDGTFVLFRRRSGLERTEVSTLACLRICLSRIEAIFARFQLPDHHRPPASSLDCQLQPQHVFGLKRSLTWRSRALDRQLV